ncbi:MAG TPA: DUF1800 family protein, partial [Casimicrobiaceae bacterium]|nr:DUF1800 family protein [Casimicrobiaceae bacterium]
QDDERIGKRRAITLVIALAAMLSAAGASALEPTATVIEFYNASLNHYFITAFPEEAAMLDQGVIVPGWTRTGVSWHAFANASDDASAVPVCRFYGSPIGPNSHFYTADAAECASVKQDAAWRYEAIAFYIEAPQNGNCGPDTTPVYRSFAPGTGLSDMNHRYLVDMTMFEHMAPSSILEGVVMCSPLSSAQKAADAVRLLEQATFGPSDAQVAHVLTVGTQAFLDEQFAAPASVYPPLPYVPAGQQATFCATDPDPQCGRDYYSLFLLQNAFFQQALSGDDQLRQRVAFALSQILVTSGLEVNLAYGMGGYQQLFRDNAFGNYETILTRVTLSPVMGDYLNMVNNDKPSATVQPNENYARELLQLFSIGVWMLNPDGTSTLDSSGARMPSYDQDTIEGFAHVLTGWTYPPLAGAVSRTHNPKNYLADMTPVDTNHDKGPKVLLTGTVLPAGQAIQDDFAQAIHNVFMHPNVGPFVGRQLIQKLVTGNPTPQYVARVAAVFNNNGLGVRGDMKAVVGAILTDPEARGAVKLDPAYGKLREPVLFMTGAARALGTQSDGVFFGQQGRLLGQNLFYPPSVFNYYPPTYLLADTAIVAPEFALANSSTAINRYNFANALVFGTIAPLSTLPGAIGTTPSLSALSALAGDPAALLDKLDVQLLHGTMPAAMRATILTAITAVPATDPLTRAKTAVYLVVTSSQYQVER